MRTLLYLSLSTLVLIQNASGADAKLQSGEEKSIPLVDFDTRDSRLIVSHDATVDAGKNYETVVVVSGHLDFAGSTDTLVVVSGKASLRKGSEVRDTAVVIAGSIDQQDGALLPETGIQSIGGATFDTSSWKKVFSDKFSWDTSKFSTILAPFAFIFKVALFALAFLILLGLALLAPKLVEGPAQVLREEPWRSCGVGALAILGFIPACFILAITIVGILFIPILAFVYLLASLAGILSMMTMIGTAILGQQSARWIASLLGFIAFMGALMIPAVGSVIFFALWFAGFGATVLSWARRRRPVVTFRDYASYQI